MVHRGYAYVGHGFSNGITTVDVRDPKHPQVVDFIACPPGTRAFHLQTHEDLLLAVNAPSVWTMQEFQGDQKAYFGGSPADKLKDPASRFTAGIRVYDISQPAKPVEIGFMPTTGLGPHRIWYTGGRYAYASIHFAEFTDHVFAVVDMVRSAQAGDRRALVDPRHVARRRRDADLARGAALRHASCPGERQHRVRGVARRRAHGARRGRSDEAEAAVPSQQRSAVRRRHAFAAARCRIATCSSSPTSRRSPTAARGCATSGCSTCASRRTR